MAKATLKKYRDHKDKDFRKYDGDNMTSAVNAWKLFMSDETNIECNYEDLIDFAEFIGYPFPQPNISRYTYQKIVNTYDPNVRDIIDRINGPHGTTYLKILKVKYDERSR